MTQKIALSYAFPLFVTKYLEFIYRNKTRSIKYQYSRMHYESFF